MSPRTFHIWTAGCQMNFADSLRLKELLVAKGLREVPGETEADLMVLNTCVVRESAEQRALGRLSALKGWVADRRDVTLVTMGCLVGVGGPDEELLRRFPYVDHWLPPSGYEALVALLDSPGPGRALRSPVCRHITIMQGCNNFCSYCIVPYRRGREASRPIVDIVAEVQQMVDAGTREVTLLGQNVNSYGRGLPGEPDLTDLLCAVHEVEGLHRIRFLTNHPKDMSQALIDAVVALPKVCEHIELPLQSGSDEVLRRMNRHYTTAQYRDLVRRLRAAMPDMGLATDIIVGFPGETEAQFQATLDVLEELHCQIVHIAAYSPREGTASACLTDDVPEDVKDERRRRVENLVARQSGEIAASLLGTDVEVLVEEKVRGRWRGRTRSNRLAFIESDRDLAGQLVTARVTWAGPWSLLAEITDA